MSKDTLAYVSSDYYRGAVLVLKSIGGIPKCNAHYTEWYCGNKLVASLCSSPYPGPEYGTQYRVDRSIVKGYSATILRSRSTNRTEEHFLMKAMRGEISINELPVWIQQIYLDAKENGIFIPSGTVYWHVEIRL